MDVDRAADTIAAQAPRRLRIDELLRQLGARPISDPAAPAADPGAPDPGAPDPGAPAPDAPAPDAPARPDLTIGTLVDRAAESGFGFLVGILTLIAIPFFGLSTPFGLLIALIGFQMMIGRSHPWLPRRARSRALSMAMLDRVLGLLTRRAGWLARSTRRRWEVWLRPRLIGLGIVLLALGLALPLPIPGSNMIFLIPLFIYAVGLLERDGVWIAIGHVCLIADMALLAIFGRTVLMVFARIWGWFF